MSGRRSWRALITERLVELCGARRIRAKAQAGVTPRCALLEAIDKYTTDAGSPRLRVHVEMAQPSNGRIAEIRVRRNSSERNQAILDDGRQKELARAIQLHLTVCEVSDESGDKPKRFGIGQCREVAEPWEISGRERTYQHAVFKTRCMATYGIAKLPVGQIRMRAAQSRAIPKITRQLQRSSGGAASRCCGPNGWDVGVVDVG